MFGPKWSFLIILIVYGPGVVVVNCWDMFCTLGKTPRTKKTLPDFRERYWVTRHSRVFCGLTGCQRDPRFWGITKSIMTLLKLSLGLYFTTFSFEYFHYMVYPMSYTPRFRIFCHLILLDPF